MESTAREQASYARRRGRIIEESISAFAAKGCFDLRVQSVAQEADIAKGCIYLHFTSKTEMLRATLEELESKVLGEYERRLQDPEEGANAGLSRKLALIGEILLNLDYRTGRFSLGLFQRLPCSLENLGVEVITLRLEELVVAIIHEAGAGLPGQSFPPATLAELFIAGVTSRSVREMARETGVKRAVQAAVQFFLHGAGLPAPFNDKASERV